MAEPALNKGTAFTDIERQALGLIGLLPDSVETIDQQVIRTGLEFDRLHDDLERHVYLRALQDHNEVLFYAFVQARLHDTIPIVYTPTVGLATQEFSRIYRRSQGLFLSWRNRHSLDDQFAQIDEQIDVVVVTDGERILGLGDQGVGGIGIPNGKLALYSAFGGIDPARTLPVVLDVGTNRQERLDDPQYLGWRNKRLDSADYDDFVEQFVAALTKRFPDVLLQWEDFAQHNATRLLHRYRDTVLSFNDDIEGTAAVALAAIWSAVRRTDRELRGQRFCIVGAGSAGTGIATMLVAALQAEGVREPLRQIFMTDRYGLVHQGRDDLLPHQVELAHPTNEFADLGLDELVLASGATVLVGVSGQPGLFTKSVVTNMTRSTDRPIIMPMSNPTSRAEATPADLIAWTDGSAVVATGSPFDPVTHNGVVHTISQANNVYVFPGLGLGLIAVGATKVTPPLMMAAAQAVFATNGGDAPTQIEGDVSNGLLPPLEAVPQVSRRIAAAVGRAARDAGLTEPLTDDEIDDRIRARVWRAEYPILRADSADQAETS